ncbi:MAG TPA: tetratricopeptide repeat protein [Ferruginibacter sp.]|nr:tetratricopeptide repeat protein [Ferruginibacter sp.]HMP20035.1 tetratricopeptide repeat protein [Ferruginibacter sp.]
MKKLFFAAAAILFFTACNSNNDNTATVIPEKEKELRGLVAQYPDSLLLKENLVQYFRENNNYGTAIAETEKAISSDSLNERLWYIKAMLHTENDDTLQAIQAWEKTIHISPKPEYIMSLGSLYALSKNPLAIGMGSLLLSAPHTRYQGLFIQGLYFNNTGDKEKAVDFFEQCIRMDYTNMLAHREKAIAQYDSGKYLDALKTLEIALRIKNNYDEGYYWMGRCYEKLNEKEQAVKSYEMALQADPNYIEAKDALAKLGVVR